MRRYRLAEVIGDEPEAHFMARVRRRAEMLGWVCWHLLDPIGTRAGLPDLIMVRPPRVIFAELKSQHGRLTRTQRIVIGLLEQCPGVEAYVWRPADETAIWAVLA